LEFIIQEQLSFGIKIGSRTRVILRRNME